MKTTSLNGVYKLIFSEVTEADEGDYACEVSNALGSDTCSARLRIGSKEAKTFGF